MKTIQLRCGRMLANKAGGLQRTRRKTWLAQPPLFCLLLLTFCLPAGAQYSINWFAVEGGGGTSTGGVFAVSGTIGQPDAGTMRGGSFTLEGGFWGLIAAVPNPPAPWLMVSRTETNTVVISWPASATDWRLHATPDLGTVPAQWAEIPPPYSVVGTNCSVVQPLPPGNRFYRLHYP